jgi:LysR family transcriptional regulator, glycine cleavage system transcriptional activator
MSDKKSHINGRLPSLNTLRVFEVAARHLSFVRAAQELFVTHGAVSRQIKQLETSLGVALFERRNRAVFLTPQGEMLLEGCTKAMDALGQVIQKIQSPVDNKPLVLSCESTVAIRWLLPRLLNYRERYPKYPILLLTAGGRVDFARDKVDIALRRNDFNFDAAHYVETIAPELVGPVCTPTLLADNPQLTSSQASHHLRLLHSKTRPYAWKHWQDRTGIHIEALNAEHYEHFYLSLQAATAGLGVAVGSAYMVEDDLKDGRLLAPYGFTPDGSEYVLLSPNPVASDPRCMAFLDWIRYEMAKTRHSLGV